MLPRFDTDEPLSPFEHEGTDAKVDGASLPYRGMQHVIPIMEFEVVDA
jgi:hypothetical protein